MNILSILKLLNQSNIMVKPVHVKEIAIHQFKLIKSVPEVYLIFAKKVARKLLYIIGEKII